MVRKIGADPRFSRKDQGRIFTGSSWVMRSISQRLLPAQEPPCSAWLSQGRCSLLARCNSCPPLAVELIKEIFLQNGVAGGFCQALAFQFGGFWDKRCRVLHSQLCPAVSEGCVEQGRCWAGCGASLFIALYFFGISFFISIIQVPIPCLS